MRRSGARKASSCTPVCEVLYAAKYKPEPGTVNAQLRSGSTDAIGPLDGVAGARIMRVAALPQLAHDRVAVFGARALAELELAADLFRLDPDERQRRHVLPVPRVVLVDRRIARIWLILREQTAQV